MLASGTKNATQTATTRFLTLIACLFSMWQNWLDLDRLASGQSAADGAGGAAPSLTNIASSRPRKLAPCVAEVLKPSFCLILAR
jgi:hypothetical protein